MGSPPDDFRATYERNIRAHALCPLDPQKCQPDERAIGWCSVYDADDLDLTFDKFWVEDRIVLALRVDVIRPAAQEVKRQLALRVRKEEERRKGAISAVVRRALKEQVVAELVKRTPPTTRTTDLVWNVRRGRLYFFSQSTGPNDMLLDLFPKTFNLQIDTEGPGVWAADLAEATGLEDVIGALKPTPALLGGFAGIRPDTREVDQMDLMAGA